LEAASAPTIAHTALDAALAPAPTPAAPAESAPPPVAESEVVARRRARRRTTAEVTDGT